ncbi:MAG: PKD domain-containing protein, partial [Anaerolineales bacterium]
GTYSVTVTDANGCTSSCEKAVTVYEGPTVRVDAPAEVGEGATGFVVTVDVDDVTDFDAAQVDVIYDSTVLTMTHVTEGNIDGTSVPVKGWNCVSGDDAVRVVVNVEGVSGVSGSGYLAEIHFDVVGSTGDTSTIDLSSGMLGDSDAQEIPASWEGDAVTVTSGLTADFSADPTEGYAGETSFAFTDGSGGGALPYTYQWGFGDGGTSADENSTTHTYADPGTYTVTLTITDSVGTTATKTDCITVYDPLSAGCSVDATEGAADCTIFTFSDESSGGKAGYTYAWDFGDGGTSTDENPSHVYASAGVYTPTLTVTDTLGTVDTQSCASIEVHQLGDANQDNEVSSLDVTKAERIILALDGETSGADANCDGAINVLDVTTIELIIMGQP